MAKERPGFMLYHDWIACMKPLSNEQIGKVMRAALEYSKDGVIPNLEDDPIAFIVWTLIQQNIDRDVERYQAKCDVNAYSAYCRAAKERGETPISKAEFLEQRSLANAANADERSDLQRTKPTTTPTTTTTTTPTTTTTATGSTDDRYPKDIGAGNNEFSTLTPEEFERERNRKLRMLDERK